jgi:hypothetical protein
MLRAKAAAAGVSKAQLANFVRQAVGMEISDSADEAAANRWLGRNLSKLPMAKVDPIVAAIAKAEQKKAQS